MPETGSVAALKILKGGPCKVTLRGPSAARDASNLRWTMYHLRKQDLPRYGHLSFSLVVASATEAVIVIESKALKSELEISYGSSSVTKS